MENKDDINKNTASRFLVFYAASYAKLKYFPD